MQHSVRDGRPHFAVLTLWSQGEVVHRLHWITCNTAPGFDEARQPILKIQTLEGVMVARFGDWIIRGVQGEFYPCKPEIFEATYEPAD